MDRPRTYHPDSSSMRDSGSAALNLLLHAACRRERRESAHYARDRSDLHRQAVLWVSADHPGAVHTWFALQPQTRGTTDAGDGTGRDRTGAAYEPSEHGASGVSVPAARQSHHRAGSGMVRRYYLCSPARRVHVSRSGSRLVQPIRAGMGVVDDAGCRVLSRCLTRSTSCRAPRDFQYRSRKAVHVRRMAGSAPCAADPHQHGRARSVLRQYFCRTILADAQVRRDLSQRIRRRARSHAAVAAIYAVLQHREKTQYARRPDATRDVSWAHAPLSPVSLELSDGLRGPDSKGSRAPNVYTLNNPEICPMDGGKLNPAITLPEQR